MQDTYYPEIYQNSLIMKETFQGITLVPNKYHLCMFPKVYDVIEESQYSTKMKYILLIHFQEELIFGIQQSYVDKKKPQCCTFKPRRKQILPTHTISNTNYKSFHLKVLELLPATRISIYNPSASTLNLT